MTINSESSLWCDLCPHGCTLELDEVGKCGARRAGAEKIYLEGYGRICKLDVGTIEQQHIFHFAPGSRILSIGGYGCQLACFYCENGLSPDGCKYFSAGAIADLALSRKCIGVFMSYNEPCIYYEFLLDIAEKCHKRGLFFGINTNAFISEDPWLNIVDAVDVLNIDIKGNKNAYVECGATSDTWSVYDKIFSAVHGSKHVEISTPVFFDSDLKYMDSVPKWMPVHLLDIDDCVLFMGPLQQRLKDNDFQYVYLHGNTLEDTICPGCQKPIIRRTQNKVVIEFTHGCADCLTVVKTWN